MRVLATIPHPSMQISIFGMNDKFIVKFEAGFMEQVFKFNQSDFSSMESLQQMVKQVLIDKVRPRFNEMFADWKSCLPTPT